MLPKHSRPLGGEFQRRHVRSLRRVFEPLLINQLEIPNRIARSAHGTSLALHGAISDQLIAYHAARAKGGVGLTILEAAAVHPSTITSFANLDDSAIDGYRRLMAQVRPAYQLEPDEVGADTVVFLNAKEPSRAIYDDLIGLGFAQSQNIVLAGDALAPRDIQYAISEGHRLTRAML